MIDSKFDCRIRISICSLSVAAISCLGTLISGSLWINSCAQIQAVPIPECYALTTTAITFLAISTLTVPASLATLCFVNKKVKTLSPSEIQTAEDDCQKIRNIKSLTQFYANRNKICRDLISSENLSALDSIIKKYAYNRDVDNIKDKNQAQLIGENKALDALFLSLWEKIKDDLPEPRSILPVTDQL